MKLNTIYSIIKKNFQYVVYLYSFFYNGCRSPKGGVFVKKNKCNLRKYVVLTDNIIKNSVSPDKVVRITDKYKGLFIALFPGGLQTWYMRKYCNGRRVQVRIGRYSDGYSIDDAREAARQINNYVNLGTAITAKTMLTSVDLRKLNPLGLQPPCTFKDLYEEWHSEIGSKTLEAKYLDRVDNQIKNHVLPWLEDIEVKEITAKMIHDVAKAVEKDGKTETAHRIISLCGRVLRYGAATGRCVSDPTLSLKGSIAPPKTEHMPSIPPTNKLRIGELIYKARQKGDIHCLMLLMQAYTFVRPGELRFMQWNEIDFESNTWNIPAERMKMSMPHMVPLSKQVIDILNELKKDGTGKYVFTLLRPFDRNKPANANAVLDAIKHLGFGKGEMSAHGFRSIASTILNESGKFNSDAIERQLSHVPGNKVRASYNYAQHIEERRGMMQWYADHLDDLEKKYALSIAPPLHECKTA